MIHCENKLYVFIFSEKGKNHSRFIKFSMLSLKNKPI